MMRREFVVIETSDNAEGPWHETAVVANLRFPDEVAGTVLDLASKVRRAGAQFDGTGWVRTIVYVAGMVEMSDPAKSSWSEILGDPARESDVLPEGDAFEKVFLGIVNRRWLEPYAQGP